MRCARRWARAGARSAGRGRRRRAGARFRRAGGDRLRAGKSGIPFELGIIRNHYVGRTFIEPTQQIRRTRREAEAQRQPRVIEGKRVVLVDDSSCAAPPRSRS
jgi:hypothetical protein